jgi:uncharacterized membrane protein (DUF106 family)
VKKDTHLIEKMGSEPDWSKQISNSNICNWFFAFAIVNAVLAVVGILGMVAYAFGVKNPSTITLLITLFPTVISTVHFFFWYLLCSRALDV